MQNFFNALKKSPDHNPDYNLSWDSIIKSWEENFLGSNSHNEDFLYPLESDNSFSNFLNINNNDGKSILLSIFDKNLNSDNGQTFNCVNEDCMYYMNYKKENGIMENNTWTIKRNCDCVSKPFFRLVLKPNLTEQDIKNLLYLLADCKFIIEMGGSTVYELPKLLFAYLISEKLSNPIRLFDVNNFLETNSMEEIKNKIYKITNNSCWINQKYYVSDSNDMYIDIPLLVDFFSYNMSTSLISLAYHEVRYKLQIPSTKVNLISHYLDDIVLMFEELVYAEHNFRIKLAQNSLDFLKMNSTMEYFHCWKGNLIELTNQWYFATKFIFIIVRPHETTNLETEVINQIDTDIDISQLPQITSIELEEEYNSSHFNLMSNKKKSLIELENIWVGQFDDLIVYGIAADGVSSMKNWIRVQSECIDSIEKISFANSENIGSNFNPTNYESVFRIVNLTGIKINWSDSKIQSNIEIFFIYQNIQRTICGMTGDAYSS